MSYGARARISLASIRHNLEVIRRGAQGARIMAVIKANAYGHGLLTVARALDGADSLAVARVAEARTLREAGIDKPVAVLGGAFAPEDIVAAAELGLELVFHDPAQIDWLEASGIALDCAWLKVDTGMNRLGIDPSAAPRAAEQLRHCVSEVRLMTHLSGADDPDDPATSRQLASFRRMAEAFDGQVSVANSAAILAWQDEVASLGRYLGSGRLWVRSGLALYGLSPLPGRTGAELGLRPAMTFESILTSVKPLPAGHGVGYNGTWQSDRDTVLGIVAAGYGDGYSRDIPSGAPVLVNGRRVTVVGRISMDLTAVDLGPGSTERAGDRVVLWGEDLPVEEIARLAQTIPYTLVAGVTHREAAVVE